LIENTVSILWNSIIITILQKSF